MAIDLRGYQAAAINAFYARVREGQRSVMLCAPTGAGKTIIALGLFEHLVKHGKLANFIVDRTPLLQQTSTRLGEFHIPHGVASGTETWGRTEKIQVVSAQSARARRIDLGAADLNVVDEAHIQHRYVTEAIRAGGRWLGLSATPFTKGLADLYQSVVNVETTDQLIHEGWLAPLKIYCGVEIATPKKSSTGEYDVNDAAEKTKEVVVDILTEWEEKTEQHFGGPMKTICFANTVGDAEAIAREFRAAGYDFHVVSYMMSQGEKDELIEAHRKGEILGLISPEALQRGYDVDDIMVGIGAHKWRKSLSAVVQEAGRAMRPAASKDFALWLDCAGNIRRFRERLFDFWATGCEELVPLDSTPGPDEPGREAVCPKCQALMMGPRCRECGWSKPAPQRTPGEATLGTICVNGKLVLLEEGDPRQHVVRIGRTDHELPPPPRGWQELCAIAQSAGKDKDRGQSWCQRFYKEMYGDFRYARFKPEQHYPAASPDMLRAVEHSTHLFVEAKKRERKRARQLPPPSVNETPERRPTP